MLKPPMRPLFGRVVLNDTPAPPGVGPTAAAESLQRGYFQPAFVRQILDEHLSSKRDHTLRLWQLVVFEKWHQQYVGTAAGSSLPLSAPAFPSEPAIQSR